MKRNLKRPPKITTIALLKTVTSKRNCKKWSANYLSELVQTSARLDIYDRCRGCGFHLHRGTADLGSRQALLSEHENVRLANEEIVINRIIAKIHPRLAVVIHDLGMVWLVWTAITSIRWSFEASRPELGLFGPEVVLVLAAQGSIFWITGLYKGLWRFASLPDLWNILRAATLCRTEAQP